jgi:endonuclease/exonuclease/phosphatase family metal-dependent hydrolase
MTKIGIMAIQEVRWIGSDILDSEEYTVFYSRNENSTFGTGFVVQRDNKGAILGFQPINERNCILRVKAHFFNICFICVHAPTEEGEEEMKDRFYQKLVDVYDRAAGHDVKILVGDMNAKVGKENICRLIIGKESIHDMSNNNSMRLTDFAISRNMTVSSTYFPHNRIHTATWSSPDGTTSNQIDHILIDRRHGSNITDVRSWCGADCDSDHYMVRVNYKQKIANMRKVGGRKQ